MTANIDTTTGIPAIAYTGDKPWHGLGTHVELDAPIEEWRNAAGLNWTANKEPLYIARNDTLIEIEDRVAITRSDTNGVLGIVSSKYEPIQPETVVDFISSMRRNVGLTPETLGALDEGRKIWGLIRANQGFNLVGGDAVERFFAFVTSFNGSLPTCFMETAVRIVCENTLLAALRNSIFLLKARHTSSGTQRFTDYAAAYSRLDNLVGQDDKWQKFSEAAKFLATKPVTNAILREYFTKVFNFQEQENAKDGELTVRSEKRMTNLIRLFETGRGSDLASASGTMWGAYNAVTEQIDHYAGRTMDSRVQGAFWGRTANIKRFALDEALRIAA
jgi:phage/plasmid-like protein (TIGR03299 family)